MTIFSRIISGEIPCYKVGEDENNFAFLDINPLVEGHTLVVPKVEVDRFTDLSAEQFGGLMQFAQRIAQKMEQEIECHRVGIVVLGLDVPHTHIHLIPLVNGAQDINFNNAKLELPPETMQEIAKRIHI